MRDSTSGQAPVHTAAFRLLRRVAPALSTLAAGAVLLIGCSADLPELNGPAAASSGIRFRDLAPEAGLDHRWKVQPRPLTILQTFGYGCASFDWDGDGRQDLLLVDEPHPILYRNLGDFRFEDVTEPSGLGALRGSWRGCAVADVDGDGRRDLLLTGFGCLALLRNEPSGRWKDVTRAAGFDPKDGGKWGSSAGFMDLDADGLLDLVVLHYVRFGPGEIQYCQHGPGVRSGCAPAIYRAQRPTVWKNLGDRRFREVTARSGLAASHGKNLVLAFADANGDGRPDFYVGNDGTPADLFVNQGGFRFLEDGEAAGVAFSSVPGRALSAMGADWSDFDGDGLLDLVVTGFAGQPYSLLRAAGEGRFEHAADSVGLAGPTYRPLGFGLRWIDADNDSWPDVVFANGHVYDTAEQIDPQSRFKQPLLFFRNHGGRGFENLEARAGEAFTREILGRGLVSGDWDGDGRVDLLVVDMEGAPLLLRNVTDAPGPHLTVRLHGPAGNPDGYGARLTLRAGSRRVPAFVSPAVSYLSSTDPAVHFGLGGLEQPRELEVGWPDGSEQTIRDLPTSGTLVVEHAARKGVACRR